ncbi:MAG: hypothetical protein Q9219_006823 [cf. Caloplaca sp. 3 TL-2023]
MAFVHRYARPVGRVLVGTEHANAEESRQSMSSALTQGLALGSVNESLTEVDASLKDPDSLGNGAMHVGPFSVFSLSSASTQGQLQTPMNPQESDSSLDFSSESISDLDSMLEMSNLLGWNDLFDTGLDFLSPAYNDSLFEDPLSSLANVTCQPIGVPRQDLFLANNPTVLDGARAQGQVFNFQGQSELTDADILEYGEVLLRNFKHAVIPTYSPLPMDSKSPWDIMNCSAAVQTLADLTYLGSPRVTNASKANLFGTLACSALAIFKAPSNSTEIPLAKCQKVIDDADRKARRYLQDSLRIESTEPQKAKYKDQLMAINTLVALATLQGNQHDARCYLIDAERLLRLRGLGQKGLSRRTRLLHHVYTWLRIVGESTFTIHDYANSMLLQRIEDSLKRSRGSSTRTTDDSGTSSIAPSPLDDFLRVDAHDRESGSGLEEYKDREVGIRDIHLEDMRKWSGTMYMQIYGIPETWLSMVSQTTRLGNIFDIIDASDKQVSRSLTALLQRKSSNLEAMVCSAASRTTVSQYPASLDDTTKESSAQRLVTASDAMLGAMHSALVIFFYRRIRKLHPWILQTHVSEVIRNLKDFDRGIAQNPRYGSGTVGSLWPAFMAGCEAVSEANRDWLKAWLVKSSEKLPTVGGHPCIAVMCDVWSRRDASAAAEPAGEEEYNGRARLRKQADTQCTWIDVLRNENQWLMLH